MEKVVAIVPIKLSSRRLPNKNFLALRGQPLCWYIFKTLLQCNFIDEIYCYCSEATILTLLPKGVKLILREPRLDGDDIKANELFSYAVKKVEADIIILCQAPSPYTTKESLQKSITAIVNEGYSTAFTVKRIQKYCWMNDKPINYEASNIAQTQNISPIYEETSGIYAFRKKEYLNYGTRVYGKSKMIEVDAKEAIDIDNPEEFLLAEELFDLNFNKGMGDNVGNYHQLINRLAGENITPMSSIRHIAYDFDGVIINSLATMRAAWNKVMVEFRLAKDFKDYSKYLGLGFVEILERLGIEKELQKQIQFKYLSYSKEYISMTSLYKGTDKSLRLLKEKGYKLSLVTSKNKELTLLLLDKFNLSEIFEIVMTPNDILTKRSKPHPDGLLQTALFCKVPPKESLYVGDMMADRLAAQAAGYNFALASWGYGLPTDPSATIWFASHDDLSSYFLSVKQVHKNERY